MLINYKDNVAWRDYNLVRQLTCTIGGKKVKIDELNVSRECRHELTKVGFTTVEEIADFLEQQAKGDATIRAGWLSYFVDIVEQLKLLGLWSETMEQAWPEDIMKP